MKRLTLLCLILAAASIVLNAQEDKSKRPSPPAKATRTVGNLTVTIDYSQVSVKGRTIWGVLVPYNKVWRTGANEATTFEVNRDVTIGDQKLAKGKYSLFTIPGEKEWTVIFNKEANQWGAYSYKEDKDALRIKAKPEKLGELVEKLTFDVQEKGKHGATVTIKWEKLSVSFDLKAAK